MRVVKAIAVREPWASQIAAGATTTAFKSFRTPYRGELLIVSDEEPWYGLALAELVDVQAITREMNAPLQRGYAWVFQNVVQVTHFPAMHRSGLYTVEIPEGALPSELQTLVFTAPTPSSAAGEAIKVAVAGELRMARAGLRRAQGGFRELTGQGGEGADETINRFAGAVQEILSKTEDLVTDMVRLDALWRRELAPPTTDADVIAELGSSSFATNWRRSRLDILVVEDEPKMARGLQRSLSVDHNVRLASSKRDALAQLRERPPHVLLCDHRLEWQKTDDLFEHVRDNYPRVRRVLYSFSHLEVWNDLLQRKLVDAVVPKSAPRNALLAALF
ncbi:MAG TPA: response regulator [Polyangia bacterium]|jgi:CheY-like chemotaxis protein|nr:response regulator [Polyangia bacterium]